MEPAGSPHAPLAQQLFHTGRLGPPLLSCPGGHGGDPGAPQEAQPALSTDRHPRRVRPLGPPSLLPPPTPGSARTPASPWITAPPVRGADAATRSGGNGGAAPLRTAPHVPQPLPHRKRRQRQRPLLPTPCFPPAPETRDPRRLSTLSWPLGRALTPLPLQRPAPRSWAPPQPGHPAFPHEPTKGAPHRGARVLGKCSSSPKTQK